LAHDAHKQLSSRRPGVLLVYGEKRANAGLAGELELDGYVVHRASHPATLRERCTPGEVDLVIFGKSPHRGFDVLRALRAGELAPGASGVRVLWLSTSREPAAMSVLRAFECRSPPFLPPDDLLQFENPSHWVDRHRWPILS